MKEKDRKEYYLDKWLIKQYKLGKMQIAEGQLKRLQEQYPHIFNQQLT